MEDNVLEQYKKIEGDWKYDYYISRYGSVVRESHMDSSGKLVPRMMLSYILPNKSATVKLVNKDGLQRKVNVASLVLKYFAGIDVKDNRDIIYRDGNRFNCIFENLKYRPDDIEEKVEKEELKEIKEVGRVTSTKYSNLVVYYGSEIVSYFKNTSEAANELIDLLNVSRDTIVSSIGKSIKKDRLYHSLKFVCVDDGEYTQITKDIEKQDLSLYLDNKENLNNKLNKENLNNKKDIEKQEIELNSIETRLNKENNKEKHCKNKDNILNIVETKLNNKEKEDNNKETDNKENKINIVNKDNNSNNNNLNNIETNINIVNKVKEDSQENINKQGNKDIETKINIVETKNLDNKEDIVDKETNIVTKTKNSSNIVNKLDSQDIENIVDKDKETLVKTNTNNTNTKVISKDKYKKLVDKVKEDIKQEVIQEILEVLSKELDLDLITKFVDNKEAKNKVKEVEKKLVTKNLEKEKSVTREIVDIIENKQDIVDKETKSNFVDNTLSKAKSANLFDDIDTDEAYAQFERDMFKEKFYNTYKRMYGIDLRKKR